MSTLNNITSGLAARAGTRMPKVREYKAGPRRRKPIHPGVIIKDQLDQVGLTPYAAAPLIGVTPMALRNVINENSSVTPEMALRLGTFFDNGPDIWLKLQVDHDLYVARERIAAELKTIKTWREIGRPAQRGRPRN